MPRKTINEQRETFDNMQCHNKNIRDAIGYDLAACTAIRGKTRDNPISAERLRAMGVTEEAWRTRMANGDLVGSVFECDGTIVGYCFADTKTAEILVLALLPEYEGRGIGKSVLADVVHKLQLSGHKKLWLAASPDPAVRAYGFYRHLGWVPSGDFDAHNDEILIFEGTT